MTELPAHSPLGASSAERWMKCPGSVALINRFRDSADYEEGADPDYRRDGTEAHALAAHCLTKAVDCWEFDDEEREAQWPNITAEMMDAVQEYLEYVRKLSSKVKLVHMAVERRVHLPDFHPMFFGTLDAAVLTPHCLHIVDYKHGVGVVVDAANNSQLMYYAYGLLCSADFAHFNLPAHFRVSLTIVQPRAWHPDGTIRSWSTTAGSIREWAQNELRPAMEATADSEWLEMGQHCRFCPAKLVCPAMMGLANKAFSASELTYAECCQLDMLVKARKEAIFAQLQAGTCKDDTVKLVKKRADRVFKDGAPLVTKYGDAAYQPAKLMSPAMVEKALPGGKEFVAEWAFTPDAGYTAALRDDKRREVKPQTPEQKFGDPSKYVKYISG